MSQYEHLTSSQSTKTTILRPWRRKASSPLGSAVFAAPETRTWVMKLGVYGHFDQDSGKYEGFLNWGYPNHPKIIQVTRPFQDWNRLKAIVLGILHFEKSPYSEMMMNWWTRRSNQEIVFFLHSFQRKSVCSTPFTPTSCSAASPAKIDHQMDSTGWFRVDLGPWTSGL